MLESLTFSYGDGFWTVGIASAFEDTVSKLPHLQIYDGPLLYEPPPRGLSCLPSLKCLSLDMRYAPIEGLRLPPNSFQFPALSALKLEGVLSIDSTVNFLQAVDQTQNQSQSLSVAIHFSCLPSAEGVRDVYSVFSAYHRFRLLSVTFRHDPLDESAGNEEVDGVTTLEMFRPLLRTSIRKLDLDIFLQVSLTNDDIAEIGGAWPQLEVLKINGDTASWGTGPSQITLNGVRSLLKACPCLSELSLEIHVAKTDCDLPEWQLEQLDLAACDRHFALKSFNDLESQIHDLTFFCVAISQLAPKVSIGPDWQQPDPLSLAVREVQAMCRERDGRISAWSWDELEERLGPIASQPRYEDYTYTPHEDYIPPEDLEILNE